MDTVATVVFMVCFFATMLVVPWLLAGDAPRASERPESQDRARVGRFTSERERRLWLWAVLALAVIYGTLGQVEEAVAALRERDLLQITSTLALIGIGGVLVLAWSRTRPGRREVSAAIAVTTVYLVALSRASFPERTHLFEYGLIGMLIHQALLERRANGRAVPIPALIAAVATVALGWIDELIQALLPNRVYDFEDVIVNGVAALAAIAAGAFMTWARGLDLLKRTRSDPDGL